MPPKMPRKHEESQALAAIQDALIAAGAVTWRCNTGVAVYGAAKVRYGLGIGAADLVGVYRGRFFGVEVKSSRGRQSAAQKAWQRAVEGAGGILRARAGRGDGDCRSHLPHQPREAPHGRLDGDRSEETFGGARRADARAPLRRRARAPGVRRGSRTLLDPMPTVRPHVWRARVPWRCPVRVRRRARTHDVLRGTGAGPRGLRAVSRILATPGNR